VSVIQRGALKTNCMTVAITEMVPDLGTHISRGPNFLGTLFLKDQKSGALMRLGTISVIARLSSGSRVKMAELGTMKI